MDLDFLNDNQHKFVYYSLVTITHPWLLCLPALYSRYIH